MKPTLWTEIQKNGMFALLKEQTTEPSGTYIMGTLVFY